MSSVAYNKTPVRVQRLLVQPINLIFRYLQNRARVSIWLYEMVNLRMEGYIVGFDEFMNLILDDAEEINIKNNSRRSIGRILLKGDTVTLIQSADQPQTSSVV